MEQYLDTLAKANGTQTIGANQRTIDFTAVASGGTGKINITFDEAHGLKKGHVFYNPAGAYAGVHRVTKVISPTVVQVAGTFGATGTGTVSLTAALNIDGFFVNLVPLTIAEVETYSNGEDTAAIIATTYTVGQWYPIQCKKIRISAGEITVIRKPVPTDLAYTNR